MIPDSQLQFIDAANEHDWRKAGMALQTLRPDLNIESFVNRRNDLWGDGYRLIGICIGSEFVSIASYTISPHSELGRELLIHDLATKPEFEGRGYGRQLLTWLEEIAANEHCGRIFVHTRSAQIFYERNGYAVRSTGMIKMIESGQ